MTDVEFVNTPEKPSLTIYKYDSETGKPLQGAEFNINFWALITLLPRQCGRQMKME